MSQPKAGQGEDRILARCTDGTLGNAGFGQPETIKIA